MSPATRAGASPKRPELADAQLIGFSGFMCNLFLVGVMVPQSKSEVMAPPRPNHAVVSNPMKVPKSDDVSVFNAINIPKNNPGIKNIIQMKRQPREGTRLIDSLEMG